MNYISIKNISFKSVIKFFFLSFLMIGFLTACDTDELPEEGSIPDETPPSADFSFAASPSDYQEISFANLSISSTDYAWDFGDGNTSTEANPSNAYTEDGMYTVKLTASDKLGQSSTTEKVVEITEPAKFIPEIMNPGFDIEGDDSYRDFWRNGELGGPIQITGSPVHDGVKSAKLPSAGDRIGYQLIPVSPNTDYKLNFYYTMKDDDTGTLTVSILGGPVSDPGSVGESTIAFVDLNDQSDPGTYVPASLEFNTGIYTEVAIYFGNVGAECRIDTFTIE